MISVIILLAFIQGITEFFPVSSSAHLAILQNLWGYKDPPLLLDLWLHMGTVASILVYYRKDLHLFFHRKYSVFFILTTLSTGIVGLILQNAAETAFASLPWIGLFLIFTSAILLLHDYAPLHQDKTLTILRALGIGIFQGLAVFPGISRSGLTITGGLFLGLSRKESIRYAFLAAVPTIILATLWETFHGWRNQEVVSPWGYLLGFVVAFFSGWAALTLLVPLGEKKRFHFFALYCIMLGGGLLAFA